jgi:hypothetical protein
MSNFARVISGALLLAAALTGCGAYTSPPVATAQQRCEQSGGVWRSASGTCQCGGF